MKTKNKPLVSWGIWAGGLSLVMGIVTREHLVEGFTADNTGMSAVIAGVFAAGLIISFLAARELQAEWKVLRQAMKSGGIPESRRENDLAALLGRLSDYKSRGETVDINVAIDTYHAKHNSRARSVSIMAALVISMGLLGTVIGLIMSISGLGGMVENVGLSRATMMEALKMTVAGMGTAFYTTFFGALGGLVLRAVAVSQQNALSELCSEAAEYADANLTARLESKEEEINRKVSEIVSSFDAMQLEIESITARFSEAFSTAMAGFGQSLAEAGGQALETTRESIRGVTDQMAVYSTEMGAAFGSFNESIEKTGEEVLEAFGSVRSSIENSADRMQESFSAMGESVDAAGLGFRESCDGLNAAIRESGETVADSLADFKLSVDGTALELRESVGELHTAIGEATGEVKTLSKARLDADASQIAGHLAVAADSIQQFLARKNGREENQKVA